MLKQFLLPLFFFSFLFSVHFLNGQSVESCFEKYVGKGYDASEKGNYKDALDYYKTAAECRSLTTQQIEAADSLVRHATFQLDSALLAAKVLARVNEIVGQSFNMAEVNTTLAVRLAHEACRISRNGSKLAVDVRRELLEKKDAAFYSYNLECGCSVVAVDVSPDSRYVAIGCYEEGEVKLYDRESGDLVSVGNHDGDSKSSPGSKGMAYRVAFSPDGKRLLTGSTDGTVKLWRLDGTTTKLLHTYEHKGDVGGIAFSVTGDSILTTSGTTVFLWHARKSKDYEIIRQYDMPDEVRGLAFSPDGIRAVCGMKNFRARLWELSNEKNFTEFMGHAQAVSQVKFSRDGSLLLTGSADHTAKLWDVRSGAELRTFSGHTEQLLSIDFSSNAQQIITAGMDHKVFVWDRNGDLLQTMKGLNTFFGAAALAPNDSFVVAGDFGEHLRFWPVNNEAYGTNLPHLSNISGLAVAPGDTIFLTGSTDHTAKIWRTSSTRVIWTFHADDEVVTADWAKNGSFFILGLWNGTVHIFDRNRILVGTFKGQHTSSVMSVALSPDGGRYITGGRDGVAKVWKLAGNNSVKQSNTIKHTKEVSAVAWSPTGDRIATGSYDGTAKIGPWDNAKAMITLNMPGAVHDVRFSPDGKFLLVCGAEGTAKVFTSSGTLVQTLPHNSRVTVTAGEFSSTGDTIITGTAGGWIRLWVRGKDDTWFNSTEAHTGSVSAIRQVGTSDMFLTAGSEGRARLFDYELTSLRIYRGHIDDINHGLLTPDKKTYITTSIDRSIKHWYLNTRVWSTLHAQGEITAIAAIPPKGEEILVGATYEKKGLLSRFNYEEKDTSLQVSKFPGFVTSIATYSARTGSRYAACDDQGTVRVFETRSNKLLKEHKFAAPAYAIKFSPRTGKYIAIGTGKEDEEKLYNYLYVWDWEKDSIVMQLPHLWAVRAVTFSANQELLASGDERGFIKLWRMADGSLIKACSNERDTIFNLSFSPNGNYLLSTDDEGHARLWDATETVEAEYCLHQLSLEDDKIVGADFLSNDSIVVFGKRLGPVILPNRLQQLDRDDSPIASISAAQRQEFNIELNFEECQTSNNPEEVSECAHYYIKRFQDADDAGAFEKADSLFKKITAVSSDDESVLSDYYDVYGTMIEQLAPKKQYSNLIYFSERRLEAAQLLYTADSTSEDYRSKLYRACWSYSWYLILTAQFEKALIAVNTGIAVPMEDRAQLGIFSNKALSELMSAKTDADFDRAKKIYQKYVNEAWVDDTFPTFREVFEDDFKELLKTRPDLPKAQKDKIDRIRKEVLLIK